MVKCNSPSHIAKKCVIDMDGIDSQGGNNRLRHRRRS